MSSGVAVVVLPLLADASSGGSNFLEITRPVPRRKLLSMCAQGDSILGASSLSSSSSTSCAKPELSSLMPCTNGAKSEGSSSPSSDSSSR